ncbi:tRNA glutamyl-Q(34) synthetase GluQRS [Chitinimonas koreensis]|uniref:tRNA glutamyl-Q(34) synthetase GluQRS n=1 Tax=Chitinimonas koreensis TaxID=356302 RepID=UPI0003F733ED|nr:tRNA glutamyl-Q(34) synthetase GluQRS [Chitinimonas koreensis]QNM94976.1 tRNA glutamyl-Q(34) synthetase GluQRS [Chitinimonas koreensis]
MVITKDAPRISAAYVGRFAPSPTGPLHHGSLLAAVGSYLEARAAGGRWLLRIEDLDPPREMPGAACGILRTLEAYGFEWDGEVVYQSRRLDHYRAALDRLVAAGLAYPCACTRREIADSSLRGIDGPVYPGTCRAGLAAGRAPRAWRLRVGEGETGFLDAVQGWQSQVLARDLGDFVLLRADGYFAYQLAVVVDDALQGVSHVVRGADLLDSTPRQIYLQQALGSPLPGYAHLPVLTNAAGEKLSKQTRAPALEIERAGLELWQALTILGQQPPAGLRGAAPAEVWRWAFAHWRLGVVPRQRAIMDG